MNSVGSVIANQDPDFVLLSRATQNRVYCAVMLYVFKGIISQELSLELKQILDWSGQECIAFRRSLSQSGTIQFNIKLYMYAKICGYPAKAEDFKVNEIDARWVRRILNSKTEGVIKLKKVCLKYHRSGYKPIPMTALERHLNRLPEAVKEWIGKFVSKKLYFLWNTGQIGRADTHQDLLEIGVYSVYRAYPQIDNALHLINIAKNAMHNRAMNIIQEQKTASRSRVESNDDGTFSGTLLSINVGVHSPEQALYETKPGVSLVRCNSLTAGIDGNAVGGEAVNDVNRQRELRLLVENLVTTMPPKKRVFVHLMMGEYDEQFSEWLGQQNDEYYLKTPRKVYIESVRSYLNIPTADAQHFFNKLRVHLAPYRN